MKKLKKTTKQVPALPSLKKQLIELIAIQIQHSIKSMVQHWTKDGLPKDGMSKGINLEKAITKAGKKAIKQLSKEVKASQKAEKKASKTKSLKASEVLTKPAPDKTPVAPVASVPRTRKPKTTTTNTTES